MEIGQYVFPFEIELPPWLPASLYMADSENNAIMKIKYMLVTQVEGNETLSPPQPYMNSFSRFRHERVFMVSNESERQPNVGI